MAVNGRIDGSSPDASNPGPPGNPLFRTAHPAAHP